MSFTNDALAVGQQVVSIGYGLAFQLSGPPSVTEGIISAVRRDLNDGYGAIWIQHQSTINHGNSGGPLLNLKGEVVGVNTLAIDQLLTDSGNEPVQGVFFAIPASLAQRVSSSLFANVNSPSATHEAVSVQASTAFSLQNASLRAPGGWIVSKPSRQSLLFMSHDQLVQVQTQYAAMPRPVSTAQLRGVLSKIVHAAGHVKVLVGTNTTQGGTKGLRTDATFTNRVYSITLIALPDTKHKRVFFITAVVQRGATARDMNQFKVLLASFRL